MSGDTIVNVDDSGAGAQRAALMRRMSDVEEAVAENTVLTMQAMELAKSAKAAVDAIAAKVEDSHAMTVEIRDALRAFKVGGAILKYLGITLAGIVSVFGGMLAFIKAWQVFQDVISK